MKKKNRKKKPVTVRPPDFTHDAIVSIGAVRVCMKHLRDYLMILNTAITTEGYGTLAERLAHNSLMQILNAIAPAQSMIENLHEATK